MATGCRRVSKDGEVPLRSGTIPVPIPKRGVELGELSVPVPVSQRGGEGLENLVPAPQQGDGTLRIDDPGTHRP